MLSCEDSLLISTLAESSDSIPVKRRVRKSKRKEKKKKKKKENE
jgi:hypothetical protein